MGAGEYGLIYSPAREFPTLYEHLARQRWAPYMKVRWNQHRPALASEATFWRGLEDVRVGRVVTALQEGDLARGT